MTTALASILLALAQATAGAVAPGPPPEYRVGPGDVLEVVVAGRPDLSRLPTVQPTGAIFLPRAGEVVVAGATADEIAARVAPLLVAEDLEAPEVSVRLKEYQSQFVWVYGEVLHPGRKPLREGTRLVDALLDAGGLTAQASGEVVVERQKGTFADGGHSLVVHLGGRDPSPQELEDLSRYLLSGDTVLVSTQHWVTLSGEVSRPGRYPLEDGMTLTRLIESAGGLTPFGNDRIAVDHADGRGEIEVDLRAVRSGKAVDPVLSPGDHVVVKAKLL
ncbi:MAG: SLBB domain-containing protein [Acidobacteria bacterium]|jgi:polysaccharide export outer membrane protein|nr:SLBB domain-containing protein [Acidobacteriota bacterium]